MNARRISCLIARCAPIVTLLFAGCVAEVGHPPAPDQGPPDGADQALPDAQSSDSDIAPPPPSASAVFIREDDKTQGSWSSIYGEDGFFMMPPEGATQLDKYQILPAGVTIAPAAPAPVTWTWEKVSSEARALADKSGARFAAAWYSDVNQGRFSFRAEIGYPPRRVAMYLLDWETDSRRQRVEVYATADRALLASHDVTTSFRNGRYLVWELSGDLTIDFIVTGGKNAVVSAFFFGPPKTPPGAPQIVAQPKSLTVLEGAPATLLVEAVGAAPLAYQWTKDGTSLGGATQAALSLGAAKPSDAGSYKVTVSNGNGAVESHAATLQVTPKGSNNKPPPPTTGHFVAPQGQASGAGTAQSPWSLAHALGGTAGVKAGETIWLRGGDYKGCFTSNLVGAAGQPIVVRGYPDESAKLVLENCQSAPGGLTVKGAHTDFRDLLVTSSAGATGFIGIAVTATEVRFIRLVVYDTPNSGYGLWTTGSGGELYGNLIFYNGETVDKDHGIYGQHKPVGAERRRIEENFLFNNYGLGMQLYGSDQAELRNFVVTGNIAFNNGSISAGGIREQDLLIGGGQAVERLEMVGNFSFNPLRAKSNVQLNRSNLSPSVELLEVKNNVFVGGSPALHVKEFTKVDFIGNRTIGHPSVAVAIPVGHAYTWRDNTYYNDAAQPFSLKGAATNWVWTDPSWAQWQAAGLDVVGSKVVATPPKSIIEVRPANRYVDAYSLERYHIVAYHFESKATRPKQLVFDATPYLAVGNCYELRDVQNYFNVLQSGTYSGGTLSIPMPDETSPVAARRGSQTKPAHSGFLQLGSQSYGFSAYILQRRYCP